MPYGQTLSAVRSATKWRPLIPDFEKFRDRTTRRARCTSCGSSEQIIEETSSQPLADFDRSAFCAFSHLDMNAHWTTWDTPDFLIERKLMRPQARAEHCASARRMLQMRSTLAFFHDLGAADRIGKLSKTRSCL